MEYENKILDAIEMIVDNKVNNANFDKTILATVIKCVDPTLGQYTVKYQDSTFYAYSNDLNNVFAKDSKVYILIPNNDWTRQKSILGTVDQLNKGYLELTNIDNTYENIGKNCVSMQNEYQLCSYEDTNEKILYEKNGEYNLLDLDIQGLETYLKQADFINLSAEIKTELPIEQRFRGNYGIIYELVFYDNGVQDEVTRQYVLDINQFESNPYRLFNYKKQSKVFEIDSQNFKYINKIYLFCYGFPKQESGHAADIFIKNLEINSCRFLTQEERNSYGIKFVTPQGIYFDENDADSAMRNIQAIVRIQNQYINPEVQKLSYYWFVEDNNITADSEKYNSYGGQGWKCLNNYVTIQSASGSNNAVVEWVPMDYQLTISKQDIIAKEVNYKCVAIYNENILSQTITIINYDSNYDITIESDKGTQFYDDIGNLNLVCKINGEERTENDYIYTWAKIDNNNNFFGLGETSDLNQSYTELVSNYEDLLNAIEAETAMPAASQSQLEAYQTELKEYENITRVEKNKIYHILAKEIVLFSIYRCSVYYQGIYIGSAEIKILNSLGEKDKYTLVINNGTQTFKYNEAGVSPTNGSLDNPQKIPALSFSIYDPNGDILSEDVLNTCEIIWKIPSENTFIIHEYDDDIVYNQLELVYRIKDQYDIDYINNDIELTIKYKDLILTNKTNLTFVKEGENGTNGTDFICKIVPNTTQNIDYPMIYNENLNYTPTETAKWFRLQLWHSGKKIFDNYTSGNSTENKYVTLRWEVLKNKYTSSISDPSHISIDTNENFSYSSYSGNISVADIIKATITYDGIKYFATIPILFATSATGYDIKLIKNSGFQYVAYNADGRYPQYTTYPFELAIFKIIDGIKENISNFTQDNKVNYTWTIEGQIYNPETGNWINQNNLEVINNSNLKRNQKEYKPIDTYNGECLSTALKCLVTDVNNNEVATIHIPIHLFLNKYGNAALNDWDGNHISINENGNGVILAPQIGAGRKENDNSFTGIFMGSVKEAGSNEIEEGLFGYNAGERTIELNSKDGSAKFGRTGKGQIIIDPDENNQHSTIKSGNYILSYTLASGVYKNNEVYFQKIGNNYQELIAGIDYEINDPIVGNNIYYWTGGSGLEIDLTDPHIRFGSKNFRIEKDGSVYGAIVDRTEELDSQINGQYFLTSDTTFQAGKQYYVKSGNDYIEYSDYNIGDVVPANTIYEFTVQNSFEGRMRQAEYEITSQGARLDIATTNIDPTTGDVLALKRTNYEIGADGIITTGSDGYKAIRNTTGDYFYDNETMVGKYTKDGSVQKDFALFGKYYYGIDEDLDVENFTKDDAMFIAELYEDNDGNVGFGHFYNQN